MRFRPCIDLHAGKVKQIVGSSLRDNTTDEPTTNFISEKSSAYFANMYREDGLEGGHVIMLGPGNETAAEEALAAYPGGLQIGGGITAENAQSWLDRGAQKVIVTSYLFPEGQFREERASAIAEAVGPERVVFDLSCKYTREGYFIASERWQTLTSLRVDRMTFKRLSAYCSEYLIHAVDVEGKQQGVDERLVRHLVKECQLPVTYAGGARNIADLERIKAVGQGRIDVTIGSALDIFGGAGISYAEVVAWDKRQRGVG